MPCGGTPYRWLDVGKLARPLLPRHDIGRIRYFTALVANRPGDPTQTQRQQAYLRALQTVPSLSIHYGHLLAKRKRRPLAAPATWTASSHALEVAPHATLQTSSSRNHSPKE